jgi:hypothetical protein
MNSKLDEDNFVITILSQLRSYDDHNNDEIDYLLQILNHRRDQLESAIIAKSKSNQG